MKKKLFILSIIVGIIFSFASLFGFLGLNSVKKEIAGYDGSNELFAHVQDPDTQKYYDNYWDYLKNHECTIRGDCYCDFVDNEKDCLNQFLTKGGGSHSDGGEGTVFLIKYRYLSLVLAIVSFVGTWLFYEKNNNVKKS